MEAVIREGTLRMQTSEACCDVILSCQGHRLMAHKVILSIASPLLRNLLLQDCTEPSVLIFPDINSNTMSLILDYIYSGSVIVYSNTIAEFLAAAALLKLQVDVDFLEKYFHNNCKSENKSKFNKEEPDVNRSRKKLPDLLPIKKSPSVESPRKMANSVIPSPWQPRIMPLLSDPRITDCFGGTRLISEEVEKNDANNNFQPESIAPPTNLSRNFINTLSNFRKTLRSSLELDLTTSIKKFSFEPRLLPHILKNNSKLKNEKEEKSPKSKSDSSEDSEDNQTAIKKEEKPSEEEKRRDNKHKPFKCDDCGKSFSQLRNYKYHRSVHEGTKEFAAKCPECGKVFNDRGYLSSHMKIHRDRKEYACPHCPKRFNQRVAYNMHLRIHTGVKPHECPTCGKSFSRKMLLKQHQRVHTGERPYSCPECGKTFADRSNMSLHARLHTGVKPYSCNLCTKSFTKKHHLKTHMNFHTGLKPYSCQKCGLAFSQSSNMRTHFKKCVTKDAARSVNDTNADSYVNNFDEK